MATWQNTPKNTSVFSNTLKNTRDILSNLANLTFEDVITPPEEQLKDVTFEELAISGSWSKPSKNSSTFTMVNKS